VKSECLKQRRRCQERQEADLEEDKLVVEVGMKQAQELGYRWLSAWVK